MINFRLLRVISRCYSSNKTQPLAYVNRQAEILGNLPKYYPSLSQLPRATISIKEFNAKYQETLSSDAPETVHVINGRVKAIRVVGKSMCFIDLYQQNAHLQLILSYHVMKGSVGNKDDFVGLVRGLKPGDHIQVQGYPGLSKTEQTLSLKCTLPVSMLSASQVAIPPKLSDAVKRRKNKVLDYLVNGHEVLVSRHKIISSLRTFLDSRGFIEVETPILSAKSNGANAKPFVTQLNSLGKLPLELRVAPELWLKRLCIGGMDQVYEIGKVFRNEGVDATHNPEFTTLELYKCYSSMEELIELSESLIRHICTFVDTRLAKELLQEMKANGDRFRRIELLPTLEKETGIDWRQVDLSNCAEILSVLEAQGISIPDSAKSPQQILNYLCGAVIEEKYCKSLLPTVIFHHPSIMSPLAKGDDVISKRFEVFIRGREFMNAYEEENCPQTQLAKFESQQFCKDTYEDHESMAIDYDYVNVMKYGMPPIGGLGLGIDRLCMLLLNKDRIEEVLAFGCVDDVSRQ
ncbi:lysine--tRNA ligase MSK1 Ecym_5389 [Eremothecium cymbalariae DBVPG|uniref:lysine--tRNA ligase n=1 Tax=Eremothecium cymbalariae (strain CBS 270.75 / DBVPG 7215 / KCTC 17166 / NRRL Y-17582) TaxID=931890 RepID=I6NDK2_ERECY|nr:hypothetical protein Ecym_5389 [Eremothecium cymbalariae DBVPG\